jgi:hypothetical protein
MANHAQSGILWQLSRRDIYFLTGMALLVIATILFGAMMEASGFQIRRWYWNNAWILLALLACAGLQQRIGLPPVAGSTPPAIAHWKALTAGLVFGLLDVLVIKCILHPQPYEILPPFLQPFPYSALLYPSGALEIEVTYRLMPLTLFLLFDSLVFKSKFRPALIIGLGIISALVEPILQFPAGSGVWFIGYATITGIAMNALEYFFMVKNGFATALLLRLGHYLVWHIALGIYVEYIEVI